MPLPSRNIFEDIKVEPGKCFEMRIAELMVSEEWLCGLASQLDKSPGLDMSFIMTLSEMCLDGN